MSRAVRSSYDARSAPLVVARIASLPAHVAVDVLAAGDPLEATRAFYAGSALARAALAVSSPPLAAAVDEWIAGRCESASKVALRALAYLIRMATRATPFGLFAGVDAVETGATTTLAIDDASGARRSSTRPDMTLLCELAAALEKGPHRTRIHYRTNDAALVRGDRLYVTNVALAHRVESRHMEQRAVSLKHTAAVAFVRKLCAEPVRYDRLVASLSERFEAPRADAEALAARLIEAGVILSELLPSPVGDPAAYLMERFDALDAPFAGELRAALAEATSLDVEPPSSRSAQKYVRIANRLAALHPDPSAGVLQVDLRTPLRGALGAHVLADAQALAESIVRMSRAPKLDAYRERFCERYEGADRLVPLLELTDPSLGLGWPDDASLDERGAAERDGFVFRLACEAMRNCTEEILLEGDTFDRFLPPLDEGCDPPALELGFALAARSTAALDSGDYRMVCRFVSTGTLKTVGRFAHVIGNGFEERMREVAVHAAPKDEIVAEFCYGPHSPRWLNVSIRPLLVDRVIQAGIGAPASAKDVPLDDVFVGIENDRFFLWSARERRRIRISETHAVTTTNGANLCRFLALLELDGVRLTNVDWGAAANMTYLPRLRRGRIVLSPRTWRFPRAQFGSTASEVRDELERLRSLWRMPRYVSLCQNDHRLLLDLDSAVTAPLFIQQASKDLVKFEEALDAVDGAWLPGSDGAHVAEFVLQAFATERRVSVRVPEPVALIDRPVYGPGSSWTYVKLYLAEQATDDFITRSLAPLIRDLRARCDVDRWFFVRYRDPRHHLRVRLRAGDEALAAKIRDEIIAAAESWLAQSKIARFALDTYDPEYERYGGPAAIGAAERHFTTDSDTCAAALADGIAGDDERVRAAAQTFEAMFASYGERSELVLDTFARLARGKLGASDRDSLRTMLARPSSGDGCPDLHAALACDDRAKRLRDLLHMHCNRFGLDANGEQRVAQLLRSIALAREATTYRPSA